MPQQQALETQDGFVTARQFEQRLRAPVPGGDTELLLDTFSALANLISENDIQTLLRR